MGLKWGPVSVDTQWQAHCPSGLDASQFVLDWEHQQSDLPDIRKTSSSSTAISRKHHPDLIKIQFSPTYCGSGPCRGLARAFHHHRPAANPDGQATGAAHSAEGAPGRSIAAKRSSSDMLYVPELKRPSRKECALLICDVLALWG